MKQLMMIHRMEQIDDYLSRFVRLKEENPNLKIHKKFSFTPLPESEIYGILYQLV